MIFEYQLSPFYFVEIDFRIFLHEMKSSRNQAINIRELEKNSKEEKLVKCMSISVAQIYDISDKYQDKNVFYYTYLRQWHMSNSNPCKIFEMPYVALLYQRF